MISSLFWNVDILVPISATGLRFSFLTTNLLLWEVLILSLISFFVGIFGGFVGLALGTVRLPFLLFFGLPSNIAAGTNIFVSAASSLFGSIGHFREKRVMVHIVFIMGIPSLIGAFLGGYYSQFASDALLILLIGILVFWQGIELINKSNAIVSRTIIMDGYFSKNDEFVYRLNRYTFSAGFIGAIIGVLGGLVGLILGSLRIPALIRILGLDPQKAAGTNMLIGFLMGISGWVGHAWKGQVDYGLVISLGLTAVAGNMIGSKLTGRVDTRFLVLTMGVILLIVGILLVWRGFGDL